MNFSLPLGFLTACLVIFLSVHGMTNTSVFLNPHAAIVVVGGTVAAGLICFPVSYFLNMFRVFFETITGRRLSRLKSTIVEIVTISENLESGKSLTEAMNQANNPFLIEALNLFDKSGLSEEEWAEVIEKRVENQNEKYKRDAFTFKIVGKFPPAFGLVGTSMGMIALLQGLGKADAFQNIGPSMSIALVATLYGLLLSNVFLIPMGENLAQASEEDLLMRKVVVDGVRLIMQKKHPILVKEFLQSYLPPQERLFESSKAAA